MSIFKKQRRGEVVIHEELVDTRSCDVCRRYYPLDKWRRGCLIRSINDDRGSYYPVYICPKGHSIVDVEDFQE